MNIIRSELRNSDSFLPAQKCILNLDLARPHPIPTYNIYNPISLKYFNRLCLELCYLRHHKFYHNFLDCFNQLCSCGLEVESNFNDLKKVDENILSLSDNLHVQVLFCGDVIYCLIDNCLSFLNVVVKYILNSEQLKEPLTWLPRFYSHWKLRG